MHMVKHIISLQVKPPPSTPAPGNADFAEATDTATATAATAEPEQLSADNPGISENSEENSDSSSPGLAPAELPPAEHAEVPQTALVQTQSVLYEGQAPTAPAVQLVRAGASGLLPKLKIQIEMLEDKELKMRL